MVKNSYPKLFRIFNVKSEEKSNQILFAYDEWRNNLGDIFNDSLMNFFNVTYKKIPSQNRGYEEAEIIACGSTLQRIIQDNKKLFLKNIFEKPVKIWGTGIIEEKQSKKEFFVRPVEILAVRGELTKSRCEKILNKKLKDVLLADPGLLFSTIYPIKQEKTYDVGIIPHYIDKESTYLNNIKLKNKTYKIIDIQSGVEETLTQITQCKFILSSALHGLIAADSFNIANKWIILDNKLCGKDYKFKDYYSAFKMYNEKPVDLSQEVISDDYIDLLIKEYKVPQDMVEEKKVSLIATFPYKKVGWQEQDSYLPFFEDRIVKMLKMIDLSKINSVMDIGCGECKLKKYLHDNIKYLPIDQYKTTANVILKNFNQGEFLQEKVDLAFVSGLFEYIFDIKWIINQITNNSNYVLASYHFTDYKKGRCSKWVNSYDKDTFLKLFEKNGFELLEMQNLGEQSIFLLQRSKN